MPGDQEWIERGDQGANAIQMRAVDTVSAANADADGVDGYRITRRYLGKQFPGVGVCQEVLSVNFDPRASGPSGRDFRQMRKPQTDACLAEMSRSMHRQVAETSSLG